MCMECRGQPKIGLPFLTGMFRPFRPVHYHWDDFLGLLGVSPGYDIAGLQPCCRTILCQTRFTKRLRAIQLFT